MGWRAAVSSRPCSERLEAWIRDTDRYLGIYEVGGEGLQPEGPGPAVGAPGCQTLEDGEGEIDCWLGHDDKLQSELQPPEDGEEVGLLAVSDHLLQETAAWLIAGQLNTYEVSERRTD